MRMRRFSLNWFGNVDTKSVVLSEVGSYTATLRMAVVNSVKVEVLRNKQNQSFANCHQTSKKKKKQIQSPQ